MRFLTYLVLLCIGMLSMACHDEDTLAPSEEALFPVQRQTALDTALRELFGPYNTVIEYRYVENFLPSDWYSIEPVMEDKVLPAMTFMKKMWVDVLIAGSSEDFVKAHFPRMLVLVGSPSLQKGGEAETLGEAEGGTLVRFTRLNDFKPDSREWAAQQLSTAFHEYAHILHQTFNMPDAYRNVTPDNYTLNGWLVVSEDEAIIRGMVTNYATSAVSEDFAELFANYVLLNENSWNIIYQDQADPTDPSKADYAEKLLLIRQKNAGRVFIRKKFDIMKNFLKENGLDIELVRKAAQEKMSTLK